MSSVKHKILIVEDDRAIRELYLLKLRLDGFDVHSAVDGVEGLQMAEELMPDMILLDILMPRMNGADMLQKLRETEWGADMRVIMLTNLSKDEAPSILKFLNVDRYVIKAHYTPRQVVDIVREVLR